MKHIKIFEGWSDATPPEYDEREPVEVGRGIEHTEAEQLFTPLFSFTEYPEGTSRQGNGQIDFDLVVDKTPEHAIWAVNVVDDTIPDDYKMEWDTGEILYDTEALLNFATDEWRKGRWADGVEDYEDKMDWGYAMFKLSTPEDVDYILEDLYKYLSPGHATYTAKARLPQPGFSRGSKTLTPEEIARVKRAITALIRYKKRIESNTVGGSTQA